MPLLSYYYTKTDSKFSK